METISFHRKLLVIPKSICYFVTQYRICTLNIYVSNPAASYATISIYNECQHNKSIPAVRISSFPPGWSRTILSESVFQICAQFIKLFVNSLFTEKLRVSSLLLNAFVRKYDYSVSIADS